MRTALKKHVSNYLKLRYPDWVHKSVIEELSKGYGFLSDNGARRARELVREGGAEVKYDRGSRGERVASYRYKPIPTDTLEKIQEYQIKQRTKTVVDRDELGNIIRVREVIT